MFLKPARRRPGHGTRSIANVVSQMSSTLFGHTMVTIREQDYILLLGFGISYREYNLTMFNHQKNATQILKRDKSEAREWKCQSSLALNFFDVNSFCFEL